MYILGIFLWYQIIQIITFPFILGYIVWRRIYKKKYTTLYGERFGFIPHAPPEKKIIWIHAASVGETLSTEYLITLIKQEIPNSYCYFTVGTEPAKNLALKNIQADVVSFLPYDFLPCMLLAYQRINPSVLIIIEAELWPNFLMLAHFKKTKILGLNCRTSKRSNWLKRTITQPIFTKLLHCYDKMFVQTKRDVDLFLEMGVNAQKISLLGDLKAYNVSQKKEQTIASLPEKNWTFPVLLVGSIHPGELNYYINLFKALKPIYPDLKLILAPRHFHWKKDLLVKLTASNLNFFLWDEHQSLPPMGTLNQKLESIFQQHDILVVCMMGELFNLYRYADIFFLGGTFVPVGGHNLLEPAVWEIPTIIGPHHKNCNDHAQALAAINALFIAHSDQELFEFTNNLLRNHNHQTAIKKNIALWLNKESIHVRQVLHELIELLKKRERH